MRNFYRNSAKMISILAVLSLLLLSSAAVMAQGQSAPVPTWTKCQTWAVSGEKNLTSVAKDNLCTIEKALDGLGKNVTIVKLCPFGQASSYVVFKVNNVTDDTYVLGYSAAIHVWAYVDFKISGDFSVSGALGLNGMNSMKGTVSGMASLYLTVTSCGTVTVNKSTMAIERIVSNTAVDQGLSLKVDATPSMGSLLDACNVKVTYNALNVSESLHLKLSDTIDFCPALPLLEFPMAVGNDWNVNSTMTVTGKVSGIFKESGVPKSILSKISDRASEFNGTLYLQDLSSLGSVKLDKGAFGPISVQLNTTMTCVGVSLADQTCYDKGNTVYDVQESRTGTHLYYSPNTEFITGMMVDPKLDLNGLTTMSAASILGPAVPAPTATAPSTDVTTTPSTPDGVTTPATPSAPASTAGQPDSGILDVVKLNTSVTMAPTDPAVAAQAIGNITTAQGNETLTIPSTADTVTGATPQGSTGLPVMLAAIAVVGVAIGGIVVFRMKKKN